MFFRFVLQRRRKRLEWNRGFPYVNYVTDVPTPTPLPAYVDPGSIFQNK